MSEYKGQNPLVSLKVDGKIHRGWLSCDIQLNLDALAGAFSLSLSHQWLDRGTVQNMFIAEGAPCSVDVDGQTVITGYIVDVNPSFAASAHQITVQGADKAADLVDCSAPVKDWHGRSLGQIAADICSPFGIKLHCPGNTGAVFAKFAANRGLMPAMFVRLAQLLGYSIEILPHGRPFICGFSRCGHRLGGGHIERLVWRVIIKGHRLRDFRAGVSRCGDSLGKIVRADDIECVLRRMCPAHTELVIGYENKGILHV